MGKGREEKTDKSLKSLPRSRAVAGFRLLTGYLQKHLHRIGVVTEPSYPLQDTGEHMDRKHVGACPAPVGSMGSPYYDSYWAARKLMEKA